MATVIVSDSFLGYQPGPKKTKGQKRREQRKRAKERKRMASVEASAIGLWYDRMNREGDALLKATGKSIVEDQRAAYRAKIEANMMPGDAIWWAGENRIKEKPPEPQTKADPITAGAQETARIMQRRIREAIQGNPMEPRPGEAQAEVLRLRARVVGLMKRQGELEEDLGLMKEIRRAQQAQIRKLIGLKEEAEKLAAMRLGELTKAIKAEAERRGSAYWRVYCEA